jgi:hypothetical protein
MTTYASQPIELDKNAKSSSGRHVGDDRSLSSHTHVKPVQGELDHAGGLQAGDVALAEESFSFGGVVCLGVSCINSWVVLVLGLGAGLTSGGSTASECLRATQAMSAQELADMIVVWGFLYATFATYCTVLSHGEMFAVYPTAGGESNSAGLNSRLIRIGQYHWSYLVSAPKYRAAVSWVTGKLPVYRAMMKQS